MRAPAVFRVSEETARCMLFGERRGRRWNKTKDRGGGADLTACKYEQCTETTAEQLTFKRQGNEGHKQQRGSSKIMHITFFFFTSSLLMTLLKGANKQSNVTDEAGFSCVVSGKQVGK